ncbi:MAG: hypothetical protein EOM87_02085 [Clostridia bacterium]|nr:hypothetical protein [Clostridia bacterium]
MVKKILTKIVLPVILCVAVLFAFAGCDKDVPEKSGGKAIIILPGLMASGLYDSATNEPIWDPFYSSDLWFANLVTPAGINFSAVVPLLTDESVLAALANITANDYEGNENSILNKLAVYEDGTPKVPSVVAADMNFNNPERLRYGAINSYTEMYMAMEERYGEDYDVSVFNYDFRLDNRLGAAKLEQFINGKNYEEVILLVHSNGGHVASIYLANSQANRDKVSLVACFDSPLTGSLTAITTLENVDKMLDGVSTIIPPAFSGLLTTIENAFEKQFKPLLNMYTVYQLLPSYYMLQSPQYTMSFDENGVTSNRTSFIMVDDEYVYFDSPNELYEFYLSREWAYMSNGEVRPAMSSWLDYVNASYVTMSDGRKVHSMSLVNTHYIAGLDYPTSCTVKFETQEDDTIKYTGTETTTLGDSVVLFFGSTEGAAINKIHILRNADHYDVAQNYNKFSKDMINEIIDDYIASK